MNISEKLTPLYNTLVQVETKGNSTLIMADCLKFLNTLIQESEQEQTEED